MKRWFSLPALAIILTGLVVISVVTASAGDNGIEWQPYGKGISLGGQEGKKIFLHFSAEWCGYCTKMANETFKDTGVISYLNKHFVPIKVDYDRETATANQYGVKGLPLTWFLAEDGEKISNLPGFIPADRLMDILRYIKTDSYKKMTFRKFKTR